jgi:hypothetical protein
VQPRANQVQLDLVRGALESEQEPVTEDARMVEAVGVGDERARVQQVVPIAVVAGETRDLDCQDDTDVTQADLGDESFKAGASSATATHSKIVIDHGDVWARPTEGNSSIHQTVLTALALQIMRDLLDGRLPDVDRGLAGEMGGRRLYARHRLCSTWPNQRVAGARGQQDVTLYSGGNTSDTSSG